MGLKKMTTEKNKDTDRIIDAFGKSMDMKIEAKHVGNRVHISVSYIPLEVDIDDKGNIQIIDYKFESAEEIE